MAYCCTMCGRPENQCQCMRYCMICKSDIDIRLCEDGCFYCTACREACDMQPET